MNLCLSCALRLIVADLDGEVVVKYRPVPKIKPPRRRSPGKNKTQKSDYMQQYMQDYRNDKGKGTPKVPDNMKRLRKEQKERLREKFNLKGN